MKKVFISFLCLLLALSLASCDLLGGSLSDYINEYTQNAALELYEVPETYPRDANQTSCISDSLPITLFLRNPMKYQIIFEYTFKNTYIQTLYDTQFKQTNPIQYVPVATDLSAYNMLFPAEFIEAIDTGAGGGDDPKDISGTLNAFDKETLRPFGSLDLTLRADSAPMPVCNGLMQLNRDPSENDPLYILCFEIPHSARNNDFDTIKINNNTWKIEYDASRDSIPNGIKVTPYGGNRGELIVNPSTMDNPDTPAVQTYPLETGSVDVFEPSNPASFDTFYYITEDKQTDTETLYQITITDKAGLSTTCTFSNKAEKLTPVNFSQNVTQGQVFLADIDNEMKLTIKPGNKTTEGSSLNMLSYVEYMIEMVDEYGHLRDSGEWKRADTADGAITLNLAPTAYVDRATLKFYRISARTKGNGYLTSDVVTLPDFEVLRSNHFFVNQSGDDNNQGTLTSSYKTFNNTILQITRYSNWLTDHYPDHLPSDGFYIDVPENYTVTGSDDVFNSSYLINNEIDGSTTFSGKLTIQGVDDKGNPLSGTSRRTIDAGKRGGLLSWSAVANNTATLSLKNLTFTNGCSETSGNYAGLFFKTISVHGNPDNNNEKLHVTITNCDITHMTGSFGYGIYFYGGNSSLTDTSTSTVTITDCTISDNDKTGINHSYQAQGISSYEKLILAGNTKIQNNSDGGVSEFLGLIIQSKNVIISNNTGYGVSAGAWAKIEIAGATIIDNTDDSGNAKNLYLEEKSNSGVVTRANITVTGNLAGSSIGVTVTGEPATADDPDVPFATYTSKPVSGAFVSDSGLDVSLGATEASLHFNAPPAASGSILYPETLWPDINPALNELSGDKWALTFSGSSNSITGISVKLYDGFDEVPASSGMYSYSPGNAEYPYGVVSINTAVKDLMSSNILILSVSYTFNGTPYESKFKVYEK